MTSGLLYDHEAKHEVFRFLADVGPSLGTAERQSLLAALIAGPPADDPVGGVGGRFRRRLIFDRLEWLQRYVPTWGELDASLQQLRELEPEMGVRDHPDHDHWMESGTWGGRPPLTQEEFREAVAGHGAWSAIGQLVSHEYAERNFDEPTWEDACQLIRDVAAADPAVGLAILPDLGITPLTRHHELVAACVYGLADAAPGTVELSAALDELTPFAKRPELSRALSEFTMKIAVSSDSAPARLLERLDDLASEIWDLHADDFAEPGWSDPLMRGLNTWPGFLAQYWLQRISGRWQLDRESWSGLSTTEKSALEKMLTRVDPSSASLVAASILERDLLFLFAADRTFAIDYVLPLFDPRESDHAPDAWYSFLHNPRTSPELLDAGFWDLTVASRDTVLAITARDVKQQYWRLIASASAYSTASAVDRPALIQHLASSPEGADLVEFLDALSAVVSDLNQEGLEEVWNQWLHAAMEGRVQSAPGVQSGAERAAWGDFALETMLPQAIELSDVAPGRMTDRTRFHHITPTFGVEHANLLVSVAHRRLQLSGEGSNWHIEYELSDLVGRVRGRVDPTLLRALAETALAMGITSAVGWLP